MVQKFKRFKSSKGQIRQILKIWCIYKWLFGNSKKIKHFTYFVKQQSNREEGCIFLKYKAIFKLGQKKLLLCKHLTGEI